MDPDQTAHMSNLVWVLTFCLKTTDTFRRMTGEKTLVVIGALGIELHFIRVRKYPASACSEQTVLIRIGVLIRAVWSGPSHFVKKPLMTGEKAFVAIWCGSFGYTLLASRDKNIFIYSRTQFTKFNM